ncbi:MAG: sodium:proton antiporter [Candidatus Levybacteria bacterium]|nr:sodium:proton antiporter [Candidatus Levybacteria bacterium]
MESIHLLDQVFYITAFLLGTSLLYIFSSKISFPYTIALLLAGFLGQLSIYIFQLDLTLSLSPDFTYYVLLPLLLFEAAMHINIHQFKRQFKTVTFLATFGLMLSIFVVAIILALFLQLPFAIALLFGAIISATDPIAVLALFKTLGAPKRLSLVADGESMFNDATAVIAFRLISTFVVAQQAFQSQTLIESTGTFLYVFLGSIFLGTMLGYFTSVIVKRIRTDQILNATILTSLALGSFVVAEHTFHVSGVMTTVIAGLIFGNLARGRMKQHVIHFVEEYFGYLGFLSLSLVFFFASFNLDLGLFTSSLPTLAIVVLSVLIARAVSVYGTVFLSNRLPLFKNEPNIPMSWQHILNWGGLRGVIPLVLVYSLPDTFAYKQLMLQFTFAALLFTLFVNGLTIKGLLVKLKLHLPKNEEKIIQDELNLFNLEALRKKLQEIPKREFDQSVVKEMDHDLLQKTAIYKHDILLLADSQTFLLSLKMEALEVERNKLRSLYEQRRFPEQVLYEFESELDLQQDALEFPQIYTTQGVNKKGEVKSKKAFRKRVIMFRRFIANYSFISKLLHITEQDIITERYTLLRARLFTSYEVVEFLDRLEKQFPKTKHIISAINEVRQIQEVHIKDNKNGIVEIANEYPEYVNAYQKKIISRIIES